MKKSKLLSLLLCMAILLSCIVYIPVANVAAKAETVSTEKAIFIGSTTKSVTCAFIPLNITPSSTTWYKLSFKCKMLKNGRSTAQADEPSIGIIGQAASTASPAYKVGTCPSWAGAYVSESYDTDDYNYNSSLSSGVYSMYFKLDGGSWNQSADKYSQGNRSFYLTIGNAAYRNFSSHIAFDNLGCSFIFSDVSLYQAASQGGATSGSNLISQINDSNVDFSGTYFLLGDGNAASTYADSPLGASANKWHIMNMPDHVKYITVPSNYNTSGNYDYGNFTSHSETTYTREYYTNSNYSGLTFGQIANSDNKGYEVISDDVNKKMIIIDANHEGEEDNRTSKYITYKNKPANLFIPLSLGQYNINKYGATTDTNYLVKVSFKAVRLEGSGYPVLGRITPRDTDHSQALGKMAKNLNLSSYYSAENHETYTGGNYSYNESTGEFVGWVRMKGGDTTYKTIYGTSDILTIGNSEHVWETGRFDTTEFNTSFAISNIKIDLYSASGSYTVGSLVAEDIGPDLYADNIDVNTPWAYQCNGQSYSCHSRDVARAKQHFWNAEGNVGMVHAVDLSTCMNSKHSLVKHTATANTCEYYSCATCGKNYATPYGLEEITDISAKDQMIYLDYAGNNAQCAFYPLKVSGFTGNQYFKFTCKVECFGEEDPVVSTLYSDYDGFNICGTPKTTENDGDFSVVESSYDSETGILTGYIKGWIATNYNESTRYPFRRYNPISGNIFAILVGNGNYSGSTYQNTAYNTSFAITEPSLYKVDCTGGVSDLEAAKSSSLLGENLIAPITDKTVDFDTDYSTSWTAVNNPLSAKTGKWYKLGAGKNYTTAQDIPDGLSDRTYYKGSKMLCISGNSSNNFAIDYETTLQPSTAYILELDYKAVGGAEAVITPQVRWSGGDYQDITVSASPSDNGRHYYAYISTWGSTSASRKNFKLYLGEKYTNYQTGSVYFANIKLYKRSEPGTNLISNGLFSGGLDTKIEQNFNRKTIEGWDVIGLFGIPYVTTEQIPSGFFSDDSSTNYTNVYEFKGSNTYKPQFGFTVYENASYQITYDYECSKNRAVNLYLNNYTRSMTLTKNSSFNKTDGKFQASYTLTNNTSYTDGAGTISFALNGNNYDSAFSISNIRIYKLDGSGNPTGGNLAYDLNTILTDADYGVSSVGSKSEFTLGTGLEAIRKDVKGHGVRRWIGNATKGTAYSKVFKTDGNLFKYYTVEERFEFARAAVVNGASNIVSQSSSKFYDPNGDSVIDILDMVLLEYDSINDTDTQFAVANDA
ncbi:MAG: hypothetical protein IJT84_02825 [Clostridia bacterium]|nr:hypothetical protein [Clostridia bacterium]